MPDSTFTFRVDEDLKAASPNSPANRNARQRSCSALLMRDAVERRRDAQEHDAWFRTQVGQAVAEADDPAVERIPHDQVSSTWHRQRSELRAARSRSTA